MFINCRHCNALVATDPASDEPPERCPRCAGVLRTAPAPVAEVAMPGPASDAVAEGSQADDPPRMPAESPAESPVASAGPATTIIEPEAEPEPEPAPVPEAAPVPATEAGAGIAIAAPVAARDDAKGAWARAASLLAGLARKAPALPARRQDPVPTSTDEEPAAPRALADEAAPSPTDAAPDSAAEIDAATQHDAEADADTETETGVVDETPAASQAIASAASASADLQETSRTVVPATAAKPAPSFAAAHRAAVAGHAPRHRWRVPAAIVALCAVLALQVLLADRARLAADARWRPLLSTLCGAFGCSLPPWREPQALVLVSRDVRPHSSRKGVLRATATFRNDARWAQAWPQVVLVLSDVDGRAVGARAFDPRDYLDAQLADDTLSSGQSAMIRLDVVEPAADVVAFSFEFR